MWSLLGLGRWHCWVWGQGDDGTAGFGVRVMTVAGLGWWNCCIWGQGGMALLGLGSG